MSMKNVFILILISSLLLNGCSKGSSFQTMRTAVTAKQTIKNSTDAENEEAKEAKEAGAEGIEVENQAFTVEMTLPASFYQKNDPQPLTQEDVDQIAQNSFYKSGILNEDGSVTYKMSRSRNMKLLLSFRASVDAQIEDMLHGEDSRKTFTDITYNKEMSEFTIMVDPEKYSVFDALSALLFYVQGAYYQRFSLVPEEQIDVQVEFVNKDTQEIIKTSRMTDMAK